MHWYHNFQKLWNSAWIFASSTRILPSTLLSCPGIHTPEADRPELLHVFTPPELQLT